MKRARSALLFMARSPLVCLNSSYAGAMKRPTKRRLELKSPGKEFLMISRRQWRTRPVA